MKKHVLIWPNEDVSTLVRKYLPPGTIFEMYQFYVGWCDAHHIEKKASHLEQMTHIFLLIFRHQYISIYVVMVLVDEFCGLISALQVPIQ